MRVRLTRLSNHDNALRTPTAEVEMRRKPKVGQPLELWGEPLTPTLDVRLITTSPVVSVTATDTGWEVRTENTHYLLERLDEE